MPDIYSELSILLDDLEAHLKAIGQWQSLPPSAEALNSAFPFCADQLSLTEWLQWIYLTRMRALVDGRHPLPPTSNILDYADIALAEASFQTHELKGLIRACDELINQSN